MIVFLCVCAEEEVKETKPKEVVVQEQLLLTLESAYPNILPVDDLAQYDILICLHSFIRCCS